MHGGLIQLFNTNAEDVFLTALPSINHFKIVYYRYSNFSLELKEYLVSTYFGNNTYFKLPYDGDLISFIFLQVTLPSLEEINPKLEVEYDKWKYLNRTELPYLPAITTVQNISFTIDNIFITNTLSYITNLLYNLLINGIIAKLSSVYTADIVNQFSSLFDVARDLLTLFKGGKTFTSPIFNAAYLFYITNTSLSDSISQGVSYNPIIGDLIINLILNFMMFSNNTLLGFRYILTNQGIQYYNSETYLKWYKITTNFFNYLVIAGQDYGDLNSYFISTKTHIYIDYTNTYNNIQNLDSSIITQTNTSSIETLAKQSVSSLTVYNYYVRDQLIILGYEYNYIYYVYGIIDLQITDINSAIPITNLDSLKSAYILLNFPDIIINYLINYYTENYATSSTIKYQFEYLQTYSTNFNNVLNSISTEDPFFYTFIDFAYISNVQVDVIRNIVGNSNVVVSSLSYLETLKILSDISFAEITSIQLINSAITAFASIYNYGLVISDLKIVSYDLNLFNGITDINQLLAKYKNILLSNVVEIESSINLYKDIDYEKYLNDGSFIAKNSYVSLIDEFSFSSILDQCLYVDNTPIIIGFIESILSSYSITLNQTQIDKLTLLIKQYNINYPYGGTKTLNINDTIITDISNAIGLGDLFPRILIYNILVGNPYFADTTLLTQDNTTFSQLKEYVTFQSYLNQIFIEEMYYEYVYEKTYELFALYKSDPITDRNKWISKLDSIAKTFKLTLYQQQILRSFTFFNIDYISEKIGDISYTIRKLAPGKRKYIYNTIYLYQTLQDLTNNTLWSERLYFLNILSYEQYFNYVKTNYNYAMTIFNKFKQKSTNRLRWNIVLTIPNSDINLTVVEDYYLTNKFNYILQNYNKNSYDTYVNNLLTQETSNFNNNINTKFNSSYNAIGKTIVATIIDLSNNVTNLSVGLYYTSIYIETLSLQPNTIFDGFTYNTFDNRIIHYENHTNKILEFKVKQTVGSYIIQVKPSVRGKVYFASLNKSILDGEYNLIIKKDTISIYPNTLFIGYNQNNIVYIYRNTTNNLIKNPIINITHFKIISLYNKYYKNNTSILNDDYYLNNDLTIDWNKKKLVRTFLPQEYIYSNKELLLWYYSNDFVFLSQTSSSNNLPGTYIDWTKAYDKLPYAWIDNIGEKIIKNCQLIIGDQKIDEIDNYWMTIYNSYFRSRNIDRAYNNMIGNIDSLTTLSRNPKQPYTLFIPLMFWFARSNELALPIIALTNVSTRISFQLEKLENLVKNYSINTKLNQPKTKVLVEYIYLDLQERLHFITKKHFYVINTTKTITNNNVSLDTFKFKLNNPVIDLFLVFRNKETKEVLDIVETISLILNGKEIYQIKDANYNKLLIPNEKYYTGIPGIITYCFSLYPTQVLPSGSINFYYITNAFFKYSLKPNINPVTLTATLYAREYNILEIMSGQAGLVFTY